MPEWAWPSSGIVYLFKWDPILVYHLALLAKKKIKNHARVIFHPFAGTPPLGRSVWILTCWVIADVITHAKFCDNRFRGFGVLIPPNFAIVHRNSWSSLQQCKHYRAALWQANNNNWRIWCVSCFHVNKNKNKNLQRRFALYSDLLYK